MSCYAGKHAGSQNFYFITTCDGCGKSTREYETGKDMREALFVMGWVKKTTINVSRVTGERSSIRISCSDCAGTRTKV